MKNRTAARQGLLPEQEKILISMERHWAGLTLFVADPDIPMDNNWTERLIRLGVMGRNNYYGHHAIWAGELAAMVFSLIETCQLNGLNPYQFLLDYFNACIVQILRPRQVFEDIVTERVFGRVLATRLSYKTIAFWGILSENRGGYPWKNNGKWIGLDGGTCNKNIRIGLILNLSKNWVGP